MSTFETLPPPPIRVPFLDQKGLVTSPWLQWFRMLYSRVGGALPPDIGQFDPISGPAIANLQQQLNFDLQELRTLPPDVDLGPENFINDPRPLEALVSNFDAAPNALTIIESDFTTGLATSTSAGTGEFDGLLLAPILFLP